MEIRMPGWLDNLPEERQAVERTCFLLRVAALYIDPRGSLAALSLACGLADNTLATVAKRQDKISPEIAILVENTVGREIMPRHLLRPDLFVTPEG